MKGKGRRDPASGGDPRVASMPRSARVESSDAEEERKAEPVTATLNAVTGLEDPAISEDALSGRGRALPPKG